MNLNKILLSALLLILINIQVFSQDLTQLNLETDFEITIFAKDLDAPRQMVEGENGTIFVAERGGQILALIDADKNGQIDSKIISNPPYAYKARIKDFPIIWYRLTKSRIITGNSVSANRFFRDCEKQIDILLDEMNYDVIPVESWSFLDDFLLCGCSGGYRWFYF